jgi:hypothetical protein
LKSSRQRRHGLSWWASPKRPSYLVDDLVHQGVLPPDLRLQASSFREGPAVEETKLFKPGFRKNQVSVSSCGLAFRLERSNLTQGSASMFDDQPLASRVRQAL